MDDNAFPELNLNLGNFQIGNIYNADVMDRKSVVSALAISLAAAKSSMAAAAAAVGVAMLLAVEVLLVWQVVTAEVEWW